MSGEKETDKTNGGLTPDSSSEQIDSSVSRRGLLAGLSAGIVTSTAGCLTTLPTFGQRVRYGEIEEPSRGAPRYRDWLPETFDAGYRNEPLQFEYVVPGQRGEETTGVPQGGHHINDTIEYLGVSLDAFAYVTYVGGMNTVVGHGEFDRMVVEETLDQTGYQLDQEYQGYHIYYRTDIPRAVALSETSLLVTKNLDLSRETIREVLETGAGAKSRQHESDEAFALLTDAIGGQPSVTVEQTDFTLDGETPIYEADAFDFDGESVYGTKAYVFPPGTSASKEDMRAHIEQFPKALDADRVDLRSDGRVMSVIGKLTPDAYHGLEDGYSVPLTTWGVEYDEGAKTVQLEFDAGERIDASQLQIMIHDFSEETEGSTVRELFEPTQTQFDDEHDTVEPGDSVTVDLPEEWLVVMTGESPDGEYSWQELKYNSACAKQC